MLGAGRSKRITDLMVERLPFSGARTETWDKLSPGLAIRVGLRRKTWVLMHRHRGHKRRLTLGHFPAMKVAEARATAAAWREMLDQGRDPAQVAEQERKAQEERDRCTTSAMVALYLEREAVPKQKSHRDTARRLKILADAFGDRPVAEITRRDIIKLVDDQVARGLTTGANRLLAHTRRFFNWLVSRDIIPASPAAGIGMPHREVSRDRVLDDEELVRLWAAADKIGYPFGDAFKLLVLTGQRVGEVSSMRRTDVNLDRAEWVQPRENNKSGRTHVVPLCGIAVDIVADAEHRGPFVFTSTGDRPIAGWARIKTRLGDIAGVDDWVLHDIRRTFATRLAEIGTPRHVTESLLNHAPKGADRLAAVYQRFDHADEKRRAVEAWERRLRIVLGVDDDTKVVELKR